MEMKNNSENCSLAGFPPLKCLFKCWTALIEATQALLLYKVNVKSKTVVWPKKTTNIILIVTNTIKGWV